MDLLSRRSVFLGATALGVSGCVNLGRRGGNAGSSGASETGRSAIDNRVDKTREYLFSNYPGTRDLAARAQGILFMPLITEAGLMGLGGSYGRGALRVGGQTVDYYSAVRGSIGFQFGGQQYASAVFFMTPQALDNFRNSRGWAVAADARYATPQDGATIGKESTEIDPVIVFVFGQQGLIAGASLGGIKYSRISP